MPKLNQGSAYEYAVCCLYNRFSFISIVYSNTVVFIAIFPVKLSKFIVCNVKENLTRTANVNISDTYHTITRSAYVKPNPSLVYADA